VKIDKENAKLLIMGINAICDNPDRSGQNPNFRQA